MSEHSFGIVELAGDGWRCRPRAGGFRALSLVIAGAAASVGALREASAETAPSDEASSESTNGDTDEEAAESSEADEHQGSGDPSDRDQPSVAITLNAAGLALFGPDLNVAYGGEYTGFVRVRAFGLGYLAHSMFTPEDNRELSMGSISVGLGGHKYFGDGGFVGPYVGLVAEYLMVEIEESQTLGTLTTNTSFLIPAVEGGYRTTVGPLLLGGGAQLGYALAVGESCEFTAGECEVEPREDTVYGQIAVDVGVRF